MSTLMEETLDDCEVTRNVIELPWISDERSFLGSCDNSWPASHALSQSNGTLVSKPNNLKNSPEKHSKATKWKRMTGFDLACIYVASAIML